MSRKLVVMHVFKGGRFEGSALPVAGLADLVTYSYLLVETAKDLWRADNPVSRRRISSDTQLARGCRTQFRHSRRLQGVGVRVEKASSDLGSQANRPCVSVNTCSFTLGPPQQRGRG